ncbi:MAG TPA: hypothetical protein VJU61_25155 [Polyangiaceae bacterium]|nr:hypothetical protein [Polyangiaceae bacterium]
MSLHPDALPKGDFALEAHVPGRYVAATAGDIVAFHWVGDAERSAIQQLELLLEKQTASRTKPASALHIVHPRVGLPNAEVRGALISLLEGYARTMGCVGVALLGTGFWASAMRSALTGIRMIVPMGALPMRFAQDVDELLPWFCATHQERTGRALHPASIQAVLHQLRDLAEGPATRPLTRSG